MYPMQGAVDVLPGQRAYCEDLLRRSPDIFLERHGSLLSADLLSAFDAASDESGTRYEARALRLTPKLPSCSLAWRFRGVGTAAVWKLIEAVRDWAVRRLHSTCVASAPFSAPLWHRRRRRQHASRTGAHTASCLVLTASLHASCIRLVMSGVAYREAQCSAARLECCDGHAGSPLPYQSPP